MLLVEALQFILFLPESTEGVAAGQKHQQIHGRAGVSEISGGAGERRGDGTEKTRCVRRIIFAAVVPEILQAVRLSFRQMGRMTWVRTYKSRE